AGGPGWRPACALHGAAVPAIAPAGPAGVPPVGPPDPLSGPPAQPPTVAYPDEPTFALTPHSETLRAAECARGAIQINTPIIGHCRKYRGQYRGVFWGCRHLWCRP